MPTSEQVLAGLRQIANNWRWLAVIWHVYLGAILVGLVVSWRPSRRLFGILMSLPLLSVSVLAWSGGNPFNGTSFGLVGVLVLVLSARLSKLPVCLAAPWISIPGVVMVGFGWLYPHFLETGSLIRYLYSAPTGLIPCPTLSMVIGLGLVAGGLNSRAWAFATAIMGLFYGIFGAARLGVGLDWILLVGAIWLLVVAMQMKRDTQAVNPEAN